MDMKKFNIAIDGPAGAGKSSIAKAVASRIKCIYIDTGAMYRSVGIFAHQSSVDLKNEKKIADLIEDMDMQIKCEEDGQHICINGKDMNSLIRTPEASMAASSVALIPAVRLKLVELQRRIAENSSVIMDGRDIGTYVLPDADVKIFLTASVEERAGRRYKELIEKGQNCTLDEVISDMIARDKQDTEREFAPLKQAEDSILLDTTGLSFEESVNKVIEIIEKSLSK